MTMPVNPTTPPPVPQGQGGASGNAGKNRSQQVSVGPEASPVQPPSGNSVVPDAQPSGGHPPTPDMLPQPDAQPGGQPDSPADPQVQARKAADAVDAAQQAAADAAQRVPPG